jgi:hypothetical protein
MLNTDGNLNTQTVGTRFFCLLVRDMGDGGAGTVIWVLIYMLAVIATFNYLAINAHPLASLFCFTVLTKNHVN